MFKQLASLSLVKTTASHKNQSFIELLIPFIATLIVNKQYSEIDLNVLTEDFKQEYSIDIPYHTLKFVIQKSCKQKYSIVSQKDKKFFSNLINAEKFSINEELEEHYSTYSTLIAELNDYIDNNSYSSFINRGEELLINFYKNMDFDFFKNIIINGITPTDDSKKEKTYIVAKFLSSIRVTNTKLYHFTVDTYIGYLLAKSFQIDDLDKYNQPLNKLTIFIDTKFFLNLLDPEGNYLSIVYNKYLDTLKENEINLKIFEHTRDEVLNILDKCEWLIDSYDEEKAFPMLSSYHYNHKTKEDIIGDKALFKTYLESHNIQVESVKYLENQHIDQIDSKELHDKIIEIYNSGDYKYYPTQQNEKMIWNDVKSVEFIYKLRKGTKPTSLKESVAIFLTSNSALARAVREFDQSGNTFIAPCLTETFFNSLLWIRNPQKMNEFNEERFMFQCTSILKPDLAFKKKFYAEVEKMKDKFDPSYLQILKSEQVLSLAYEESFGNEKTIDEESIQETTHKIILKAKKDGSETTLKEIDLRNSKRIKRCAKNLAITINSAFGFLIGLILLVILFKNDFAFNILSIVITCLSITGYMTLFYSRRKIKQYAEKVCTKHYEI